MLTATRVGEQPFSQVFACLPQAVRSTHSRQDDEAASSAVGQVAEREARFSVSNVPGFSADDPRIGDAHLRL
jgi:hypothetical protein